VGGEAGESCSQGIASLLPMVSVMLCVCIPHGWNSKLLCI
jgi:hypothetical protein